MIYTKNQQEALDYRGGNLLIMLMCGKEAKPRQRQPRLPLYRIRMEQ